MALKQFYVVKRKDRITNGKPTYYVRLRDESGELHAWRSTGETNRTRAENWALKKLSKPQENEKLTFEQFAKGWFTEEHAFVKGREARGSALSPNYLESQKRVPEIYSS